MSDPLFSILTLPQYFDQGRLRFNVVFIPRNLSPIDDLTAWGYPAVGPFADAGAGLLLDLKVIAGGQQPFLNSKAENPPSPLPTIGVPASARPIFEYLKTVFKIDDLPSAAQVAPPVAANQFIQKYLPQSYRQSFNFTNPKTRDAVVDDSYHCAFKNRKDDPAFKQSPERISWGEVYGYCLRNPELAKKVGLIYAGLEVELPQDTFAKGGWAYVDFRNDPAGYFAGEVSGDQSLAKRYAARIPALANDEARILFAPVLFPVSYTNTISGAYDEAQREADDYDDGFAKIVHTFQPISTNFLLEDEADDPEMEPNTRDRIDLGFDDETCLIRLNRQLREDPSVGPGKRLDAPTGVFNYRVDVREVVEGEPDKDWVSLNRAAARQDLLLAGQLIIGKDEVVELGTEIYPFKLDSSAGANYWLPMYFTSWFGQSLVIPDEAGHAIYRINDEVREYKDGDDKAQPLAVQLQKQYLPAGLEQVALGYGRTYEFRVRMGDISGGGPTQEDDRLYEALSHNDSITFKRFVPPNKVRLEALPEYGDLFTGNSLVLRRPVMEYPNVQFTNQYPAVIDKLIAYSNWASNDKRTAIGLPDPDVTEVEITVEIKALQMDNALSVSRRESYIHFYTVTRPLQALNLAADVLADPATADPFAQIETPTEIELQFVDAKVLNFGDPGELGDFDFSVAELQAMTALVLPRARDIRLTIRPLAPEDDGYFGRKAYRQGRTIQLMVRRAATNEQNLFDPAYATDRLEGMYLQPDEVISTGNTKEFLTGSIRSGEPSLMVQRLAGQLNVESRGMSLLGHPGVRVQFGCTRRIRHSLAPDATALTFSSRTDFFNHWLVSLNFRLQRDWTWDAMALESFVVSRRKKFREAPDWGDWEEVGAIHLERSINLQALQKPQRQFTQLVFIDAVEPKPDPTGLATEPFPDLIDLEYRLTPQFKAGEEPGQLDEVETLALTLPVTTIPAQEVDLRAAGVALTPYRRDERYANTEPRQKYLWIELKKPVADPNDALFIRFLAYAPDPMLSDLGKYPEMLRAPKEPPIALDPELIRVIRPNQADDLAGLSAMTELTTVAIDAATKGRYYLVPLPPGLHPDSDELFGFFTYELRIGHNKIWSTAQGRFGRPLRVTGVQHPAPQLFCGVERREDAIVVSAPYATAVYSGKNVTSYPPVTELWCLLYAQVKMADNQDYRNVLIGENRLSIPERARPTRLGLAAYTAQVRVSGNTDGKLYGSVQFSEEAVLNALESYGIPGDAPLSVLCVEFLPTNYYRLTSEKQNDLRAAVNAVEELELSGNDLDSIATTHADGLPRLPLSRDLGKYRILRTSPLTEVPAVCCVDC